MIVMCGNRPRKTGIVHSMLRIHVQILASALLLPLAAKAQAPRPDQTEWESEPMKLRLFYPNDLVKADTAQAMQNGNLTLFGVAGASDPALAQATHCLRPILLLNTPQKPQSTNTQPTPDGGTQVTITPAASGTILLAELDIDCLTPEQQATSTNLLAQMAEIVNKVPGMKPIAQPSTYTIGYQNVHMAAAQGQPQTGAPPSGIPQALYTMGISTTWSTHLLVWYFSSNSIDALNRITKTTVRFGRAEAAPLYPVTIGNAIQH